VGLSGSSPSSGYAGEILDQCYRLGQLFGVAIRSKGVLDIDLVDVFWKQLMDQPLSLQDLMNYDYTTWSNIQFRDPRDGHLFDEHEFAEYYAGLTYTTSLSDGVTKVELRPGGGRIPVRFESRWQYAMEVVRARFQETSLQMDAIRRGLYSIIPRYALSLLSWNELRLKICGEPSLDLAYLKKRTVYAPRQYTEDSPVVQNFWKTLASFSDEDRGKFLQFAWARSRLPPESELDSSWRMKLNILDGINQEELPTAETCFFNVNLPHYESFELMSQKLHLAVTHCSSITS